MEFLKKLLGKDSDTARATVPEQQNSPKELVFEGVICAGMGMYSELIFPSHSLLPDLPADWSDTMFPGSLNIGLVTMPETLKNLGEGYGITCLDNGIFTPAVTMPQQSIGNNSLGPTARNPNRGIAQAWRAAVAVKGGANFEGCWIVRRMGSAYCDVLELMSDRKLRETYKLRDGDEVTLTMKRGENLKPTLVRGLQQRFG